MTALVAISDQTDIPEWGWLGWAVFILLVGTGWALVTRREHVRRQKRKKQGRA